jgi:hypothetical protein
MKQTLWNHCTSIYKFTVLTYSTTHTEKHLNYNRELVLLFPLLVITAASKQPFLWHKVTKPLQIHNCVGHDDTLWHFRIWALIVQTCRTLLYRQLLTMLCVIWIQGSLFNCSLLITCQHSNCLLLGYNNDILQYNLTGDSVRNQKMFSVKLTYLHNKINADYSVP